MVKKIGLRIIAFCVLLVATNYVYKQWFYENDLKKHSDVIFLVKKIPLNTDILYLGESSNNTFGADDSDTRSIAEFIGDYFPNFHTYGITKQAAHAGIFEALLQNVSKETKIKTVIITLNLRSFDASWTYSDLETPLQKSLVLVQPYPPLLNRFLLSFKAYDIKTAEERMLQVKEKWRNDQFYFPYTFPYQNVLEWDNAMADIGVKDSSGNYDQKETELACHFIKNYAFHIDTLTNARIKQFDAIVKLAKKRNWNLVFNLLPENTEKASELVGKDLIFLMERNAQNLVTYYQNRGVVVVNNLNEVANLQFLDREWPTEHYAEKGRKKVAEKVAEGLKKWHHNEFENKVDTINVLTNAAD